MRCYIPTHNGCWTCGLFRRKLEGKGTGSCKISSEYKGGSF
uniref:Uncharacterized protein n=1 Tax=Anguilla anguilla TaxID=7936 RepID=A0A0E9TPT2_ANGAN